MQESRYQQAKPLCLIAGETVRDYAMHFSKLFKESYVEEQQTSAILLQKFLTGLSPPVCHQLLLKGKPSSLANAIADATTIEYALNFKSTHEDLHEVNAIHQKPAMPKDTTVCDRPDDEEVRGIGDKAGICYQKPKILLSSIFKVLALSCLFQTVKPHPTQQSVLINSSFQPYQKLKGVGWLICSLNIVMFLLLLRAQVGTHRYQW